MAAIQELHAILSGAPAMAFFRCPVCRGDTHAFANARAAAYCPVCLRDHNPVVVLVPCGHAYCVGCMEGMLDHHGGEAVIDMRPLAPQALVAEEEIMFDGGLIAGVEDYQPPPPNYGDAASVGSDDTQFDEENEAMLVEVDAVTLPVLGAPRASPAAPWWPAAATASTSTHSRRGHCPPDRGERFGLGLRMAIAGRALCLGLRPQAPRAHAGESDHVDVRHRGLFRGGAAHPALVPGPLAGRRGQVQSPLDVSAAVRRGGGAPVRVRHTGLSVCKNTSAQHILTIILENGEYVCIIPRVWKRCHENV